MKKFLIALSVLTLSLSAGAALACGDDGCDKSECSLSEQTTKMKAEPAKPVTVKPGFTLATLSVEGMICGNCVQKVTGILKGMDGVDAVSVDLKSGKASVSYNQKTVETKKLVEAVSKLGYKVKQI